MVIKELSLELMKDWFDFFDNIAFTDHDEWRGCYCTAFYYPKPEDYFSTSNKRKDYAKWLIESGRMTGYLAYEKGKVIGWVNVNNKGRYPRLINIDQSEENILSIVCFIIGKAHRGQGVAHKLLERIIADAKKRGYSIIEAYPKKGAKSEYGKWNGPYGMYKRNGSSDFKIEKTKVVRKSI